MASTQDLNSTELATLLNNVLDPTDAANIETWAANHLRDGLTPVETIDTAPPYPGWTAPIPDANGFNPEILVANDQTALAGSTINTTNFTNLRDVIATDAAPFDNDGGWTGAYNTGGTHLTFQGDIGVHLYLGDLAGAEADGNYYIIDFSGRPTGIPSTANNVVIGGDDAHDFIQTGAGADRVTLGNGNDDLVIDNLGGNQVIKLGTGTGDSVNVSTTASGTTVTTAGADATITFGAGNNEIIKALGGGSTLNFTGAGTAEVVHLSNSGGNTVNVGSGGGSITIDGLAATDALFFADTQANATVTPVSKTEVTIAFADTGQSVDLHFANHAAEVAIVGSLHYGA
jgi:hypothetical protein